MYVSRKTNSLIANFSQNSSYCYTQTEKARITLEKSPLEGRRGKAVCLCVLLAAFSGYELLSNYPLVDRT